MAEAPVMADKSAKLRTPQLATAALLVKGALYEKYKTAITVGYKYEAKTKGASFNLLPVRISPHN